MILAELGFRIRKMHRYQRLRGRVAVLQILKDRAAKGVLSLLRHFRQELAVSFDDKARQSAFEVSLGFPGEFVSLNT